MAHAGVLSKFQLIAIGVALSLSFSACIQPQILGGGASESSSSSISLSLASLNIAVGGTQIITASGGTPPYSFKVSGGGAGGTISGTGSSQLYTAPANMGRDTIIVTDQAGNQASTQLAILPVNWTYVGEPQFSPNSVSDPAMALNAQGIPYVAYSDPTNGGKLTVMYWTGSVWSVLGYAGISTAVALNIALVLDVFGNPYVAFEDAGNSNAATVMHWNGSVWVIVGDPGFSAGAVDYLSLTLDHSGNPNVFYSDGGNGGRGTVMGWNGSTWVTVGSAGFTSGVIAGMAGSIGGTSIAFNAQGSIFVGYPDISHAKKATVMYWNGSTWAILGSAGISSMGVGNVSLVLDSSGNPFVGDGCPSPQVFHWNGSSWTTLGSLGTGGSKKGYISLDSSGNPYYVSAGGGLFMHWNGSSWTSLGPNTISEAFTGSSSSLNSLAMNASGTLFALVTNSITDQISVMTYGMDFSASAVGSLGWSTSTPQVISSNALWPSQIASGLIDQKIQYYADEGCWTLSGSPVDLGSASSVSTPVSGTAEQFLTYRIVNEFSSGLSAWSRCSTEMGFRSIWSYLGPHGIPNSFDGFDPVPLVVDSSNNPFIVFNDPTQGGAATVMHWNGSAWTTVGSAGFTPTGVFALSMALDSFGNPYVAYVDSGNSNKVTVMHWNGTSWASVGSPGFSTQVTSIDLVFTLDHLGNPSIAYNDASNVNAATVMQWNGSAWNLIGSAGFSTQNAAVGSLVFDSSNNPYIAIADGDDSSAATVYHWNGSAWVTVGAPDFSAGSVSAPQMLLDSSGNPYIAFSDGANGNGATVLHWNGSAWTAIGTAGFSPGAVNGISLALDSSGNPYVAFGDGTNNNRAAVMHWNGSSWSAVGQADISVGFAMMGVVLQVSSSGSLFISYSDQDFGDLAVVRRYDP